MNPGPADIAVSEAAASSGRPKWPYLFSPAIDFLVFGGSAIFALALLPVGAALGVLHSDTPGWTWITTILLIDVAHVYATGFRVYFDLAELRRRPWLYSLTPVLAWLIGGAIYSESVAWFWSVLAYLAVFHFIRQQYGWVALYRARENDHDRMGWWIDAGAIYLATVYPLIFWHTSTRQFHWFVDGDFFQLPSVAAEIVAPIYWLALIAYTVRSLRRGLAEGRWNPGKDLVVLTTAVCWYVGIIALNSDYAFTVTNVIIHGVPYMVLIYWYRWHRDSSGSLAIAPVDPMPSRWRTTAGRVSLFLGAVWVLAYAEELLWGAGEGLQCGWLFSWFPMREQLNAWNEWLVPALAVPQVTHYVLDGFIWRRGNR